MRILIFDCETTGLLPSKPYIIEFASIVVESTTRRIERTYSTLIKPPIALPPVITKITKLTDAALADAPSFVEVVGAIEHEFKEAQFALAHNMPFDFGVLSGELARHNHGTFPFPPMERMLCSVQLYFHLHGRRLRLEEWYTMATNKPFVQTHRALDDVMALHEILCESGFYEMSFVSE